MSSHHYAMADSLECYMDEVVENFEDFVKKSLLLFSVGVCTVVVMLVYVLKVLTDRGVATDGSRNLWHVDKSSLYPILSKREVTVQHIQPKLTCTSANTIMKSIWPSYEEQVLRNIGFSNCHKIGESFEDLHMRLNRCKQSADRKRQSSMSPIRQRRDLSLPSKMPDSLPSTAIQGVWNIPKTGPYKQIPIFDNLNDDMPPIVDKRRDETKSATKDHSCITPVKQSVKMEENLAKRSWTILTRDAAAFQSHIRRMQTRVSDRGSTTPSPQGHRLLTSLRRHSPPPPPRKAPAKACCHPRHGDYFERTDI